MQSPIAMPMITLHRGDCGWYTFHHGSERERAVADGWVHGRMPTPWGPSMPGQVVLAAVRAAYPGVDVRLITTALVQNQFEIFNRSAARRVKELS